ncbi:TetR family transcriptional regulator [Actinomadura pelletieri DSM 43383]|uniref:TetR family transcriptional regulator n=1 Tax=Actinomadura pelletieri DSM 43383 TaxID=1120940 RepID=A0A495QT24_9ACTN|nr:TetR family transcriptional regulator [Actinomadura pelletieri]RKS76603.1 TetR family transcriptional regulator [Actinomadura pelletieri DSM 43383]
MEALAAALAAHPAASMTELAAAAGMSRATLHRRFPSRDALIAKVAEEAVAAATDAVRVAALDEGTALEACERLVTALVPLGSRFAVLLREGVWVDELPTVAPGLAAMEQAVETLIRRGRTSGELRSDLPARYQTRLLLNAVFTAWEAVRDGDLGSREAPAATTAALLRGIAS